VKSFTDQTAVRIGIGLAMTILSCTWILRGKMDAFQANLDAHFTQIDEIAKDRWGARDQRQWGFQMDVENRALVRSDGKTGLVIPDVDRIIKNPASLP
jgi:hypothetical protein